MRGVVRSSVWMYAAGITQGLIALFADLILIRHFAPEIFGEFALIQAVALLALSLFNIRLRFLVLNTPRDAFTPARRNFLVSAAIVLSMLGGVTALGVVWIQGSFGSLAIMLVAGLAIDQTGATLRAVYEREFDYRRVALMETIPHFASYVLAIGAVLLGAGAGVLYVRLLFVAIASILSQAMIGRLDRFTFVVPSWSELKALFVKSRGLWVDGWLNEGFERVILIAAGAFAGGAAAGILYQARRFAGLPAQLFYQTSFRVLVNHFSQRVSFAAGRAQLLRILLVELSVGSAVAVAGWFLVPWIVPRLFGGPWIQLAAVLQVLSVAFVATLVFFTLMSFLIAHDKMPRFVLVGRGVQFLVLGAALCLLLWTPLDPLMTIAWALSAAFALASLALVAAISFDRPQRLRPAPTPHLTEEVAE